MKKLALTEAIIKDLISLYELAEKYVGSRSNVVQPIWDRIRNSIVEDTLDCPIKPENSKDG